MPSAPSNHLGFAIIGAMKCGTTSLFEFLAAHPDVCAPRNKEPHYFTRGYKMPAAYYRHLFKHRRDGQLCGEASPTYSWVQRFPETPARLAHDAPDVRLVFLIRDPLDRVLSQLRHRDLVGTPDRDLVAAVRNAELWERSSYATTLTSYLEHFDQNRIHVADLDDLSDPNQLAAVLAHLGLDAGPLEPLSLPEANASADRQAVPGALGRIASTPIGSVVRDLVPRDVLGRLKRPVRRSTLPPVHPDQTKTQLVLNKDDLRAHAPDECASVQAQYETVRRDFLGKD